MQIVFSLITEFLYRWFRDLLLTISKCCIKGTQVPILVAQNVHTKCNRVGFRWRIVGDTTGWLGSSVVECSHGQRKARGSSHNFSPVITTRGLFKRKLIANYTKSTEK